MDVPDWWADALAPFEAVATTRQVRRTNVTRATVRLGIPRPAAEAQGLAGYLCRDGVWRYEAMEWVPDGLGGILVNSLSFLGMADAAG